MFRADLRPYRLDGDALLGRPGEPDHLRRAHVAARPGREAPPARGRLGTRRGGGPRLIASSRPLFAFRRRVRRAIQGLNPEILRMLLNVLALAMTAVGQGSSDWYEPFPAHKVIGNVYYVGSKDLATYPDHDSRRTHPHQ